MGAIYSFLSLCITVYIWIVIIQVLISWLTAFEVINTRNPQAQKLVQLLHKATDPVYTPIRKVIPSIGGIDITPILVIFGLTLIQKALFGAYAF